jgi:hypothetical protein
MKHRRTVPTPPDAWLVVWQGCASGAFPSRDDPELEAMIKENRRSGHRVSVWLDHPSIPVTHYGIIIHNPAWLTARDNWFERYQDILEPHLLDPRTATVYTLAPGQLVDPLATHKSSKNGPFPFPKGKAWPRCGLCNTRLGFLGTLDFRRAADPRVPPGSLVLHVCVGECGVCPNRETWEATWIKEGDELEILGDSRNQVLVGTPWEATEYPLPMGGVSPEDLASSGPFLAEHSIFFNFSCFADKVGGRVFWIQPGYASYPSPTPVLSDETSFISDQGERMTYIGQMISSPDIEIGDCGIAYILYSPRTDETIIDVQYF